MRVRTVAIACTIVLAVGGSAAWAQMETTLPDVGAVKVDVKRDGGTVAVTNQFTAVRSTTRLCNGVCYYPSGTKSTSWTCTDNKACKLECPAAAPKGSC